MKTFYNSKINSVYTSLKTRGIKNNDNIIKNIDI